MARSGLTPRLLWRLFWRSASAILVTTTVVAALFLIRLLSFGSVRFRRPLQRAVFRFWSRALCRILGIEVAVSGTPPSPPCILVSNHLSYIDVPVIAKFVPARFVARADVRAWPGVGWMCRSVETIFIDRASRRDAHRTVQTMRCGLETGDAIVLFPEGTSGRGDRLLPFRAPLLAAAAELDLPVHHVALGYRTPGTEAPADLAVCWWGDMDFLPHVRRLLTLSRIEATAHFGHRPLRSNDRKQLALALENAISENFVPLVDDGTPGTQQESTVA